MGDNEIEEEEGEFIISLLLETDVDDDVVVEEILDSNLSVCCQTPVPPLDTRLNESMMYVDGGLLSADEVEETALILLLLLFAPN